MFPFQRQEPQRSSRNGAPRPTRRLEPPSSSVGRQTRHLPRSFVATNNMAVSHQNGGMMARKQQRGLGHGIPRVQRPAPHNTLQPIQDSTIGDRLQVEQLHTMSQLTAGSQGSSYDTSFMETHFIGPPAHQNSQAQSSQDTFPPGAPNRSRGSSHGSANFGRRSGLGTISARLQPVAKASCRRQLDDVSVFSDRANTAPSVQEISLFLKQNSSGQNPSKMLLHMPKARRTTPMPLYANARSGSSFLSCGTGRPSRSFAEPLLSQPDSFGTSCCSQRSTRSAAPPPRNEATTTGSLSEHEALKHVLQSELRSLFADKMKAFQSSLRREVSCEMEERSKSLERTLVSRVSAELKPQIIAESTVQIGAEIRTLVSDKASSLNARLQAFHLESTSEIRGSILVANSSLKEATLAAKTALDAKLVDSKEELICIGREELQKECEHQLEKMKRSALTWIGQMQDTAESVATSMVKKCEELVRAPAKVISSLLSTDHNRPSDTATVHCSCDRPAISPVPITQKRPIMTRAAKSSRAPKKRTRAALSQDSSTSSSTKQAGCSWFYDSSSLSEPPPLQPKKAEKMPVTPNNKTRRKCMVSPPEIKRPARIRSKTATGSKTMRKRTRSEFSQETISTISAAQYGQGPNPPTSESNARMAATSRQSTRRSRRDEENKENKTPTSNKTPASNQIAKHITLVTPGLANTPNTVKSNVVLPRHAKGGQTELTRFSQRDLRSSEHEDDASPVLDTRVPTLKDDAKVSSLEAVGSQESSFKSDAPILEVIAKGDIQCASPLSDCSIQIMSKQNKRRTASSKAKRRNTNRRTTSGAGATKRTKSTNDVKSNRAKKTYSKRCSSAAAANDGAVFTFSFESAE